jgi:hypothetical protein
LHFAGSLAQADFGGRLRCKAQQHGPVLQLVVQQVAQVEMRLIAVQEVGVVPPGDQSIERHQLEDARHVGA